MIGSKSYAPSWADATMSNEPTGPLLDIRNLSVHFGATEVVSSLSFSLAAGEIMALVGESGSGKTQTALAVLGLSPPSATVTGSIVFEGTQLPDHPAQRRALRGSRIALVPQDPMSSLNPYHMIGGQIAEVMTLHLGISASTAKIRVLELLDAVGISDPKRVARSYAHQLSGGMRQRALIAMALAGEPRLIIADEPTTALDSIVQARILDLLGDTVKRFGLSILLISHNLAVVSRIANRVAVFYAGNMVETAKAAELFADPRHPYTKALIAAIPRLSEDGQLPHALPGSPPSGNAAGQPGCIFQQRCPVSIPQCKSVTPVWRHTTGRGVACHRVPEGEAYRAA
ncbi:ABC transporter ATP-binding protein [Rhizobium laguerreae]|uniref:ABC transporter ATP-binding protein n=2 Tax=Rhizobium TaxID=379 RepID=UPI001C91995B|nr:ABC transporter ATP-binding protein [Rhizobium laguerreae]MBY3157752.1 ABC transporter ATP-binding protein [Rhizobium laguerreae]